MSAVLVTGGSRGIGAAVARLAAARGYDVCINYVSNEAAAQEVIAAVEAEGRKGCAIHADVANPLQVEQLFEQANSALGRISGLVNSAGLTGPAGTLSETTVAAIERVINVNVLGTILCSREALRWMAHSAGGEGGAIVNISSVAAEIGSPGEFVWYAASKGAIDSFTVGLAREVGDDGVRVNAVAPGLIETDIHEAAGLPNRARDMAPGVPMRRPGSAEEAAEPILWLLSEAASYVTGAVIRVSGGR